MIPGSTVNLTRARQRAVLNLTRAHQRAVFKRSPVARCPSVFIDKLLAAFLCRFALTGAEKAYLRVWRCGGAIGTVIPQWAGFSVQRSKSDRDTVQSQA